MPRLEELEVYSRWCEDISTVDRLLNSASRHLHSLVKLEIKGDVLGNSAPLSFSMLGQHSIICKLTSFWLDWPSALQGSNQDLTSLLLRMPAVERLNLNGTPHKGFSDLTMDALPAFARHCPKLRYLKVLLDCRIPPSVETLADGYARRCVLEDLDLGKSPCNPSETRDLACWLNALVPKSCWLGYQDVYSYSEVEMELERLRAAPDQGENDQ